MLGIQNEREWAVFCDRVLLEPALRNDPRFGSVSARTEHRKELETVITQAFASLTGEQLIERLDQAQIANARMNDMRGVWQHEQLRARERWVDVDSPAGKIPALLPPGNSNAYSPRMDPIPELGEHTDRILHSLGYGEGQIGELRKRSVV